MNIDINKAFRDGNLNKWLYDAINNKNNLKEKVSLGFGTIAILQILTIFYLVNYLSKNGNFAEFSKEIVVLIIISCFLMVSLVSKLAYIKTFSRFYNIFLERIEDLELDVTFCDFINAIQYDIDEVKNSIVLEKLVELALPMVSLSSQYTNFTERDDWALARDSFSKAFKILFDYELTLSSEWGIYISKAKYILEEKIISEKEKSEAS